ncbi:FAD-dependent oxidoreductase [Agriterribacter sp.]|uniref:NAD(P)/FAD-dependent oxidoreductase n=1 Tax=Agriterribacter sp. TaxID=2821509 RepID=UPI002CA77A29|nr:FAD-dependent oxidoreductase [Agriterribacter sp.]HRP55184.1 FAD-dependent oxidoreductase [Agriterribacter sp.]
MHPQYLIIGQGIAGTLLSYEFWKQDRSFFLIDEPHNISKASLVAGAIINPINVNRWTTVHEHESYISTALQTYRDLEKDLGVSLIKEMSMLVFHGERQKELFKKARSYSSGYVHPPGREDIARVNRSFASKYDVVKVAPVWKIYAEQLLSAWSGFLKSKNLLKEEFFHADECVIAPGGVAFKEIRAEKIIFCEGAKAINNPLFKKLPFTRNRGEALLLSVPDLPGSYIYHYGIRLVPAAKDLWWCGSNYRWAFSDLSPDPGWRMQTEALLRQWLTVPFKVVDHVVAERPTTEGQQFLAGIHPAMPSAAIFNGLGTKGFLCGPLLAKALSKMLIDPHRTTSSTVKPLDKWLR